MKSKEEVLLNLRDRYGFSPTDTKWLPEGSSILEYVGIDLLVINFTRSSDGLSWSNSMSRGKIIQFSDFDPISSTYLCRYTVEGMDPDTFKEVRIIPEGFELIADDINQMVRFVPYSIHSKMVETEEFYKNLFIMQVKCPNLDIKELLTISNSKNPSSILEYSHNIGAVIKTENNEILWFRIKDIKVKHLHSSIYTIILTAWDNKRYILSEISSTDPEYKFVVDHQEVGKLKIIDLARARF